MVDYKLWYCVEGRGAFNKVIISDGKDIADLKEEIHKKCSHSYWEGKEAMELVLLKVDIDPIQWGDYRKIGFEAPEGSPWMDPMRRINEIWSHQPNQRRLHICVKLY
ncbi:hypothetical protein BJY52DRAFT_1221432 [Lactarius psammicola]|nr:hypothetical protein BJY52DRAFT_1221432 [Lactarius psammicola]